MLHTTDVCEEIQNGISFPSIEYAFLVIADVNRDHGVVLRLAVFVEPYRLDLRELLFVRLPEMHKVVLHLHLPLHHIEVSFLVSLRLKLEEDGVVKELLHGVRIAQGIEVGIHKGELELLRTEERLYLARILAGYLANYRIAF